MDELILQDFCVVYCCIAVLLYIISLHRKSCLRGQYCRVSHRVVGLHGRAELYTRAKLAKF